MIVHVLLRAGERNRIVSAEFPEPLPPPTQSFAPRGTANSAGQRIPWSIALLGAGVVGIGVGIGFGASSQGDANRASDLRAGISSSTCFGTSNGTCGPLSDAVSAQRRDATIATVGYAAGGVLLAAGAVTWLVWPRAPRTGAKLELLPGVGPSPVGLTASMWWE
jgi:hypothetical protein